MRTYSLLFKMPNDEELFCAAWAAICAYDKRLRDQHFPVHTTLIAKETWLTNLLIPPMTFLANDEKEIEGMHFDLVIDMSEDRAINLMGGGKTAAACYGAILGLDQVNELVNVKTNFVESPDDVVIIHWNKEIRIFAYKIAEQFSLNTTEVSEDELKNKPSESIKLLNTKIVFGRRSIWTYLAASAGRIVLEGYPLEEYDKTFLCKWNNPQYHLIGTQKKEDLDKNIPIIWRSLERIIQNAIVAR